MVKINFDEETEILYLKYEVSIDKVDIERFMDYLQDRDDLPRNLLVLHSGGTLRSTMKVRDILWFTKVMRKGTGLFQTVRAAVYTSNRMAQTLSRLYERMNIDRNTEFKTFESESSAVAWLKQISSE